MRLDQLTFTRFIAAISIVVFHYGRNVFPFDMDGIKFLFRQANVGVSYFFILSGFIMVIAYGNRGKIEYVDYLKRRFARIYPVYFLAILALFTYFYIFNRL
jgi:peptidoglycan/LPS O-acetylase OafA/YrhL